MLLDALRFEDDQGLWEIVWGLNSISPETPRDRKIQLAREVVFALLDEGRIELRSVVWTESAGPPLTEVEIAQLRHDDVPWYDPENSGERLVWLSLRST